MRPNKPLEPASAAAALAAQGQRRWTVALTIRERRIASPWCAALCIALGIGWVVWCVPGQPGSWFVLGFGSALILNISVDCWVHCARNRADAVDRAAIDKPLRR
jgi:hypothetical protein